MLSCCTSGNCGGERGSQAETKENAGDDTPKSASVAHITVDLATAAATTLETGVDYLSSILMSTSKAGAPETQSDAAAPLTPDGKAAADPVSAALEPVVTEAAGYFSQISEYLSPNRTMFDDAEDSGDSGDSDVKSDAGDSPAAAHTVEFPKQT